MTQIYSSLMEAERIILEKLKSKGWNAYDSTGSTQRGAEGVIMDGPAEGLCAGRRYVVLPIAENSRNPEQVMNALEKVAVKLNRETPTIEINGERYPWVGFIPYERNVKVNTIQGHHLEYVEFIQALDTIVDTK